MNALAFLLMLAVFGVLAWWYIANSEDPDAASRGLLALKPDDAPRFARPPQKPASSSMLARVREKAAAAQSRKLKAPGPVKLTAEEISQVPPGRVSVKMPLVDPDTRDKLRKARSGRRSTD